MADGLITRAGHPAPDPDPFEPSDAQHEGLDALVRRAYRATPWWGRVLAVFVLSRLVSTALLVGFAGRQAQNPWTLAHPGYAAYAAIWDGNWYQIVAQSGYPTALPIDALGHVGQNAWAFLPVYPFIVRAFMIVTGLPFSPIAVGVSVASAAGCALVLYRLMLKALPQGSALFAVTLFCFAPLSPLLQVDYAEALFLLLLATALLLLLQRRYWWLLAVLTVAAFTRPGVVAFALVLAAHWVLRYLKRAQEPFPVRERVRVAVVAVASGVLGFAWPIVAAVATGRLSAYTDTELSWRADYIGYQKLLPFAAWIQGANWWLPGGAGLLVLFVVVVLFVLLLVSPWARRLPVDLRLWSAAYAVYLLAVFFPQTSTFRVLMPLFPVLGALAVPRSWVLRAILIAAGIAGQWVWLYICWWVNGYDWTPP